MDVLILQKIATRLVMPCGLLWLALIALVVSLCWQQRRKTAAALALLLALYTAAGNSWVSNQLIGWLEKDYQAIDPFAVVDVRDPATTLAASCQCHPLDAVVVLGGGIIENRAGNQQLIDSGDRVMLAARLYHRGVARRLVTTGADLTGEGPSPAKLTTGIWDDLGVASADILQVGGRNTREEMAAVARLVEKHQWQRVGLVTSAWHMPRALRLARAQNLSLTPLPADFRQRQVGLAAILLIPDAGSLNKTSVAAKELLAGALGR